eukprot:contig_28879_g7102
MCESDDSDDEMLAVVLGTTTTAALAAQCRLALRQSGPHKQPGSIPGKRGNRDRDFDVGYRAILRDYFGLDGRPPVYSEADFERRFRLPRAVFECIYSDIKDEPFWARRINATGRPQAYPLQKLVAAFRVLAYGESYDRSDE